MEQGSANYVVSRLAEDPEFAAAYEDANALLEVLETLALRRKGLDMSQRDVARRMKTTQSAVSDLESAQTDPRVSTLQRYARALDAELVLNVAHEASYSFVNYVGPATVTYGGELTAVGFAWAGEASILPQFQLDYPLFTSGAALQPGATFDLGSLGFTYEAATRQRSSGPHDDRAEPQLVLAA